MADNNEFKSKGYHSKSEMRRLEAQKSEFEKARDEFAGNTEKHIKMYGTSTLVQRSRDLRVEGADWAREFVLDSPEVKGLVEAVESIECACEPGGGIADLEPGFICGRCQALAAFEVARTSDKPMKGEE